MGLADQLVGQRVAVDTAVFVYFIEEHPTFAPILDPVFEAIDKGRLECFSSLLSLLETLVVPYRDGDVALATAYERVLTGSRGLTLLPIDLALVRAAAMLRATHSVKTPDAIQLAAGLSAGCSLFLTNDRRLPSQVSSMRVVQLSSLVVP